MKIFNERPDQLPHHNSMRSCNKMNRQLAKQGWEEGKTVHYDGFHEKRVTIIEGHEVKMIKYRGKKPQFIGWKFDPSVNDFIKQN
jgi:hypothetical protein